MPVETLKRDTHNAFENLDEVIDIPGFLGKENIDEVIEEYFQDSIYFPKIHEFSQMKWHDEATYRHSLRVGALSWVALKGTGKKYRKKELAEFCAAGILHDCGKKNVAKEILQTKGKISREDYGKVKEHASEGISVMKDILKGDGLDTELIGLIVKYHHEDLNGNGYHNLLDAEKFNGYVQFVSIADIIDSVIWRGIYQGMCNPTDAINFIELVSTDKNDKTNIRYLEEQISRVTDNEGRPYFKNAEPGRYSREYALPYIHLFRNHMRKSEKHEQTQTKA